MRTGLIAVVLAVLAATLLRNEGVVSVFVAGFVGSPAMNLLKATLADDRITIGHNAFSIMLSAEQRSRLGHHSGDITFGFRAERDVT